MYWVYSGFASPQSSSRTAKQAPLPTPIPAPYKPKPTELDSKKRQTNKISTSEAFYVWALASLVIIGVGLFIYTDSQSRKASANNWYDDPIPEGATNSQKLAWTFQSSSESLSKADTELCIDTFKLATEWNRTIAPLVRDYLDENISGPQYLITLSSGIKKLEILFYKSDTKVRLIQDQATKDVLFKVSQFNREILDRYIELHDAIKNGTENGIRFAAERLGEAAKAKRDYFMPYARRITKAKPEELQFLDQELEAITGIIEGSR